MKFEYIYINIKKNRKIMYIIIEKINKYAIHVYYCVSKFKNDFFKIKDLKYILTKIEVNII